MSVCPALIKLVAMAEPMLPRPDECNGHEDRVRRNMVFEMDPDGVGVDTEIHCLSRTVDG